MASTVRRGHRRRVRWRRRAPTAIVARATTHAPGRRAGGAVRGRSVVSCRSCVREKQGTAGTRLRPAEGGVEFSALAWRVGLRSGRWHHSGDSKRRAALPLAPTELRAYLPPGKCSASLRLASDLVCRDQTCWDGVGRTPERSGRTAGLRAGGNSPVEGSAILIPKTIPGHGNRIAAHPWAAPALPSRSRAASQDLTAPRLRRRKEHNNSALAPSSLFAFIPAKAGIQSGAERFRLSQE
jgi:hypothetical protein